MRRKLLNGAITFALASLLISSLHPYLQVSATDTNEGITPFSSDDNSFTVTIPKNITLSGIDGYGEYEVSANGNIGDSDVLIIEPDSHFYLSSQGKEDLQTEVLQEKTIFSNEDMLNGSPYNEAKGSISAPDLSAGTWSGCFNFTLKLESASPLSVASLFALSKSVSLPLQSSALLLSTEELFLGCNSSVQVDAYLNGELVNDSAIWSSDNDYISVNNGLVEVSPFAQAGDTAVITVTSSALQASPAMSEWAETVETASFSVTVIDMDFISGNAIITVLDILPNEQKEVEAFITPASAGGMISWVTNAPEEIGFLVDGNKVTVEVLTDTLAGECYELTACYGDYTESLVLNVLGFQERSVTKAHVCSYTETVTLEPTCLDAGERTFECSCGNFYTEVIPAIGHLDSGGICEYCGAILSDDEGEALMQDNSIFFEY